MPKLLNTKTGEREVVDDADVKAKLATGDYEAPSTVAVHRFGEDTLVAPGVAREESAFTPETTQAQVALERGHKIREDRNAGIVGGAKALVGSAISGGTAGLVNPYQEAQEFHSTLSTIGGAAGQIGLGSALGIGELGALGGVGGVAAEGGAYGALSGIEELNKSDDQVTWERAASVIGSRTLFGAGAGAAIGLAGKGLEAGLSKAKVALDKYAEKSAASAADAATDVGGDLASLDYKGLRAAEKTELDNLAAQHAADRVAAKSSVVDDAIAYRKQVKEANPWLAIDEGEQAWQLSSSNRTIRKALADDPKGLRENPGSLLKPLRKEEQALEGAIANREAIAAKLEKTNQAIASDISDELATLPDAATHVELSGKAARRYGAYADVKVGKEAVIQVAREDADKFVQAIRNGEVKGASQKALGDLDGLLEQNRALQVKLKEATGPVKARADLSSPRLDAIRDARDGLSAATTKESSSIGDMLGGSAIGHMVGTAAGVPYLGHAVLAVKAVGKVANKLGADTAAAAERGSKAIQSFLDVSTKAATPARVLATKTLNSVRYGMDAADDTAKAVGRNAPKESALAEAFNARSSELRKLTQPGLDGRPVMRMEARQQMADRLAPIRAASPLAYDRIETTKARAVEFLAGKLPYKPDLPGVDSKWPTSDMEMRAFARYVNAVEDPHGVIERLATGQVTPEDAEAMRTVYPEMYKEVQLQIMGQMGQLRAKLPYQRRLALSIFSGMPVDPAMDPGVLAVLQSSFPIESGTAGGTQAPRAQPAFGSVSKEAATPAQERGSE